MRHVFTLTAECSKADAEKLFAALAKEAEKSAPEYHAGIVIDCEHRIHVAPIRQTAPPA